ncbi:MAG: glutamate mutase L [Deltaproteobacteria bacterium]|nr:glutamate mutase L [Deltaproteobacteria bacterium]
MITDPEKLNTILVTDCGSTTTKALLFERRPDGWRQTFRGEAPTTVEEPVADVTVGALNAFQEVQELSSRQIISENYAGQGTPFLITDGAPGQGIDLYLSTSSAGGGLQMMVAGAVKTMSTESAERAALGAGAIVMDAISADDGREDHERVERIRHLRPDIVLLTGGVDGGSKVHVLEAAEILLAASPRPRFGETLRLPVIYAGNSEAAEEAQEMLKAKYQLSVVSNVRPTLESENLEPARKAIHDFFLSHVMSHSPGYDKLLKWSPVPVMPTPAAVGNMVQRFAESKNLQVLCADIGGATTDVFSVFRDAGGQPIFNRTVSANLGMSYSVANVLIEAGPSKIARWLPYQISDSEIRDRLRNKMIRPTTIPQTIEDLWLEQAVCREALRLSLDHHRSLAVGLSGVRQARGIADIFSQKASRYELVDRMKLDVVVGSGGVLSHAPDRVQAALMMIDGFALEGVTQLTVDSIFMMPHLGVLCEVNPQAADQIFIRDCLVKIGYAVAPVFNAKIPDGTPLAEVYYNGERLGSVHKGRVLKAQMPMDQSGELKVQPLHRSVNLSGEPGREWRNTIQTGHGILILDGRNRPIEWASEGSELLRRQVEIFENLGLVQR